MYLWRLYTLDGSVITEGMDGFKSSADVSADQVIRVEYIPLGTTERGALALDIDLAAGERFFRLWRRTGSVSLGNADDANSSALSTVYVMGKEKDGKKILSVYLYPEGDVVVSYNHEL